MELILNDDQLQQFDTEGWLFFENVFNAEEIALLNGEAHRIFAMDRAEVFRESDGKTARTACASAHRQVMLMMLSQACYQRHSDGAQRNGRISLRSSSR